MNRKQVLFLIALGVLMTTNSNVIDKFAKGIATAEGFYVAGSRPNRNHNPGDLTIDVTGKSVGMDGMYVKYANDADGWEALRKQVRMMFDNTSRVYNSTLTIKQVAAKYTTTAVAAWANIVAGYMGVSVDTRLDQLV